MVETMLGKIKRVHVGRCGYQDAMLGIAFELGGEGWDIGDYKAFWDASTIECSSSSEWTEADRGRKYEEVMRYISDLLDKAKVSKVSELEGMPVEVTTEDRVLKSWRVLTEVL